MASSSVPRPTAGLVLVRVGAGLLLFRAGWSALAGGAPDGAAIRDRVEAALPDLAAPTRWWADAILLENPDAIAFLWRWLALAAGAGLIAGVLVRPFGAIAAVLMANAWVYGSSDLRAFHFLLGLCCVACAWSRAGRTLGLDVVVDATAPTWLTWAARPRRGW